MQTHGLHVFRIVVIIFFIIFTLELLFTFFGQIAHLLRGGMHKLFIIKVGGGKKYKQSVCICNCKDKLPKSSRFRLFHAKK